MVFDEGILRRRAPQDDRLTGSFVAGLLRMTG